jgi:2TM domain
MTHLTKEYTVTPANLKKGFRIHLLVFLLATPAIWLVWYWTDRSYPWPFWSTPTWTIGVLFHYLGVYVFKKSKTN